MVYNRGEGRRFKSCPRYHCCFLGSIDIPERCFRSPGYTRILERLRLRGLFVTDNKFVVVAQTSCMRRDQTHLWELFEPVISGMGYDLVEIEHFPNPKHGVLRLYIDKEGGINVDDCSSVSRQISALIDVEDPVRGQFNLEVSSPGSDRPLRRLQDFQRFTGSLVKLKTVMPLEGQRNFKGRLLQASEEVLVIETDTEEISIPMGAVEKARIVPEY